MIPVLLSICCESVVAIALTVILLSGVTNTGNQKQILRWLEQQEAQLSQTDHAMLHVIVAKSLDVIQNGTILKLGYGFLFAFDSIYGYILYHL